MPDFCFSQLPFPIASGIYMGVRTRFGCEPGKAHGKLSSIAMGLRVPDRFKINMVRVAYALRSSSAFIRSRNGRYMSW